MVYNLKPKLMIMILKLNILLEVYNVFTENMNSVVYKDEFEVFLRNVVVRDISRLYHAKSAKLTSYTTSRQEIFRLYHDWTL